jgi:hypothetical protein
MFIPFDPVLMLVAVVALFCYYAMKGSGGKKEKSSRDRRYVEQLFRDINEERAYERWLFTHQK